MSARNGDERMVASSDRNGAVAPTVAKSARCGREVVVVVLGDAAIANGPRMDVGRSSTVDKVREK